MAAVASKHPAFSLGADGRAPSPPQDLSVGAFWQVLLKKKTLLTAHLRVPELT